jgi:hypothetical protein
MERLFWVSAPWEGGWMVHVQVGMWGWGTVVEVDGAWSGHLAHQLTILLFLLHLHVRCPLVFWFSSPPPPPPSLPCPS